MSAREDLELMLASHGARSLRIERSLLELFLTELQQEHERAERAERALASFALNHTPEQEERAREATMSARRRWLGIGGTVE